MKTLAKFCTQFLDSPSPNILVTSCLGYTCFSIHFCDYQVQDSVVEK